MSKTHVYPVYEYVGPDGINRKEYNDCVVRAISFVTDIPYWKVYDSLQIEAPGRKRDKGYYPDEYRRVLKRLDVGFVMQNVSKWDCQKYQEYRGGYRDYTRSRVRNMGPTVAQIKRGNPKDRLLFSCIGHVIGLKHGVSNQKAARHRGQVIYLICNVGDRSF